MVAAVVSLLIVSPRLPLPAAIGAALVAAYLYLAITVFHSLRPAAVWDGITQSWSTLLTASLPTLSTSTYVALPVAVTAVGHLRRSRAGAALRVEGWSGPGAYRRPGGRPPLHRPAATPLAAPDHGVPVAPVAGRAGPGAKACWWIRRPRDGAETVSGGDGGESQTGPDPAEAENRRGPDGIALSCAAFGFPL